MQATALQAEPESDLIRHEITFGLSLAELAALIGEQADKLSMFVAAGLIEPDADGRFPVERSVESYFDYWRGVIGEAEPRA